MNVEQLREWENAVAAEVMRLRNELQFKEEELNHLQRLRELQERNGQPSEPQVPIPILPKQSGGRVSIAPIHPSYFEWNGRKYRTPGDFLDDIGEPHYFSQVRGGQSDAAQRKIIAWAKQNPTKARAVSVVLHDGTSFSLWEIADANR